MTITPRLLAALIALGIVWRVPSPAYPAAEQERANSAGVPIATVAPAAVLPSPERNEPFISGVTHHLLTADVKLDFPKRAKRDSRGCPAAAIWSTNPLA